MKKFLVPSLVVVLALLIAVPSFALEVKWGGLFRARVLSQSDFTGTPAAGTGDYGYPTVALAHPQDAPAGAYTQPGGVPYTQHNNRFDQRLRIFMDFISSENLKVVTKFETQASWGRTNELNANPLSGSAGGTTGAMNYGSGNVGADSGYLTVKNVYASFNIPGTPLSANVGVQGVALLDSWIVDTDVSGALLVANLKPFTVILGYVAGQNFDTRTESDNIDDLAAVVAYKEGPFSASLVGLWQDAHNVPASVFPTIAAAFDDPLQVDVPFSRSADGKGYNLPYPWLPYISTVNSKGVVTYTGINAVAQSNNLFDLGFQLGYKLDYLSAYLNFVKNFGSVKIGVVAADAATPALATAAAAGIVPKGPYQTMNYTGWMVDAGVNYFCGPFTGNIGGFYTSGQKLNIGTLDGQPASSKNPQYILPNGNNLDAFTYPLTTSKYFSEIIGGGILDNFAPNGGYWRGYPNPTNLWTGTVGGAWQALPTTKLALSYWYFGTSQKVPSRYNQNTGMWNTSSSIGSELDLNITQNVVDKLNLDLVGAYLFAGNAYRAQTYQVYYPSSKNVYELGARLQWTW